MTEKELKDVLDLPDSQQRLWLFIHIGKDTSSDRDLADLAFRLRDEAIKDNITLWQRATDEIFLAAYKDNVWQEMHQFERWPAVVYYFSHKAKPIHWIIAALIAKDKANAVKD